MKVQIINDVVVAYGNHVFGDDVYDAPDDYTFETYNYVPSVPGQYDINNFIKIQEQSQ